MTKWVREHEWAARAILFIFGLGVLWATFGFRIAGKVDQADFDAYVGRQAARDSTLLRDVRSIRGLLCQDRPTDSWCQR